MAKKNKIDTKDIMVVKKYNDISPARISAELYELSKYRWKMNVFPQRLFYMVSQTVSTQPADQGELFPLEYPLEAVFKYLGLENSNRRYEVLAEALEEFRKVGYDIMTIKPNGRRRWSGMSFIMAYEMAEDYPALRIKVNEDAKPLLCQLHQYTQVQPKIWLKLSTEYQNWFYSFLKLHWMQGQFETTIQYLIEQLFLENTPSYTTDREATRNFFRRVIGIEKPKGWRYKEGRNKPWDYMHDKNGQFTGTLAVISRETDINVTAYPIMEKGKYVAIHFDISKKAKYITKKEADVIHQKATGHDIQDMGKPERKGRSKSKKPETIKDLFSGCPIVEERQVPEQTPTTTPKYEVSDENLREMASYSDLMVEQFAKKWGYRRKENGNWEKM